MSSLVSPLEVYAVLQLDTIITGLRFGVAVAAAGGICSMFTLGFHGDDYYHSEGTKQTNAAVRKGALKFAKICGVSAVLCSALAVFMPSTKTAAAMILLPAITSDKVTEPLTREAGELYQLAKSALTKAVEEPKAAAEPKETK